jgi:hypothetical protein
MYARGRQADRSGVGGGVGEEDEEDETNIGRYILSELCR